MSKTLKGNKTWKLNLLIDINMVLGIIYLGCSQLIAINTEVHSLQPALFTTQKKIG